MNGQSKATKILNIKYPIIQGPMSWITNADFVSRVSNAGGLGVLGANAGQNQKASDPIDAANKMRIEIEKVKQMTKHSFAINIVMHDNTDEISDYIERMLSVAFDEGVHYFVTVGAPNQNVFQRIKDHGGVIIHRPLTPTVDNMVEAERNGADILVATGSEAGGVFPEHRLTTADVVAKIIEQVHVPLFAAGGINTVEDIRALESYHVAGLFVGTMFIVTKESPLASSAKQLIIRSKAGDMVNVSAKIRSINTAKAIALHEIYADVNSPIDVNAEIKKINGMKTGMLDGDIDGGIVSVNTHIDSIDHEMTISEVVETFGEYCNMVMLANA
ncbi:nitronate monooxygenase [Lactobacillus sp. Sy-1]|uniref:nitronate monooxygenase n=1 Tax=Lactobacillus sp. Sy-1 TaxID=2109645 RepID=UPI001C5A85F3|nr:nitronate monooxygenase [Lactobacillus sp. Sy-1]MBW1606165.1 nitronate monooxygenase [Lactobacillus sp. Sy-1]